MVGTYKTTTDHEAIKKWASKQGARPAIIDNPQALGDRIGIRLNFPGKTDEELLSTSNQTRDISWDEFFTIFDGNKLLFVYDEEAQGSDPTQWYRFDKREG